MREKEITRLFPAKIRAALERSRFDMEQLYEIRLRVNAPLILIYGGKEYFLPMTGDLQKKCRMCVWCRQKICGKPWST